METLFIHSAKRAVKNNVPASNCRQLGRSSMFSLNFKLSSPKPLRCNENAENNGEFQLSDQQKSGTFPFFV